MRHIVRYRVLTVPNKLQGEFRLTVDEGRSSPEYSNVFDGGRSTNVLLFPVFSLTIVRGAETDEVGNRIRVPWNINDSITMTKFTVPIFINEFKTLYEEMKTPEMYSYRGDRLELNDKLATKVRKVFNVGNTTLELIPVVIGENGKLMEGIRMKFNNEHSMVLLTINEMISMLYNMEHMDMDSIALNMYATYMRKNINTQPRDDRPPIEVDIEPINRKPDIAEDLTEIKKK